jgi:flagellar operon protein
MDIQKNNFLSIEQVQDRFLNNKTGSLKNTQENTVSFKDILREKSNPVSVPEELKFSKHATNRLTDRNISLSDEQMERLTNGTDKAREKGIKESLVLVDSIAFIVNIQNNTVVTAMDRMDAIENVFTNIDGAVII